MLNVEKTAAAIAELQRLMPGVDIPRMIYNDPDILLSVQKARDSTASGFLAPVGTHAREGSSREAGALHDGVGSISGDAACLCAG